MNVINLTNVIKSTVLAVLLGTILSGCATTSNLNALSESKRPYETTRIANGPKMKFEAPDAGKSLIYLSFPRTKNKITSNVVDVFMNGKYITSMRERGFYPIHVMPGDYTLTLDSKDISGKSVYKVSGTTVADQRYVIDFTTCPTFADFSTTCFANAQWWEDKQPGMLSFKSKESWYPSEPAFDCEGSSSRLHDNFLSIEREVDFRNLIEDKNKKLTYGDKHLNNDEYKNEGSTTKEKSFAIASGTVAGIESTTKRLGANMLESAGKGLLVGAGVVLIAEGTLHLFNTKGEAYKNFNYKGIKGYYTDEHLR